mmetsp:Transcript_39921/g.82121  ORF Transcript_39921/g.82121 Transcript_39921/m.82121 type:complete len:226 (-) Transcript_39921:332-1009(-)
MTGGESSAGNKPTPSLEPMKSPMPPASLQSIESAVVEAVCEDLLTSMCIEVACSTHRMAKTGILPLSKIMGPTIGDHSDACMENDGEDAGILVMGSNNKSRKRSSSIVHPEDDTTHTTKRARSDTGTSSQNEGASEKGDTTMTDASFAAAVWSRNDQQASTTADGVQQSNYAAGVDIWGNVPPKEPRTTAKCDICGRQVSALRFAPHLDKCMNLGNSRATGSRRS